jgi:Protein of unknown function (DUF3616)
MATLDDRATTAVQPYRVMMAKFRLGPALLTVFSLIAGPAAVQAAEDLVFTGMCDASGAVTLGGGKFVVADDEDNVLRVYDAGRGGAPLSATDLSPELQLPSKKKAPETDLEAATLLGDRALWLTSHGRNSKGKPQPSRLRLFATTGGDGSPLQVVGKPYTQLLDDLLRAPALANFGLQAASQKAPKQPGGLNIEGMTARPDGRSVIIGFRNPVPQAKALVVPLLNPLQMLEGQPAKLGTPRLLDLEGRGIRSMSFWRGRYLMIGGGIADEAVSRLYTWDGKSYRARAVASVVLDDFNPEGFASFEDRPQVLLLSDDGSRQIDGQECKQLEDATRKRFRGRWVHVPVHVP